MAQPLLDQAMVLYRQLDAQVAPRVFKGLSSIGFPIKPISPLTKGLPLIDSPTPLLLCLAAYLLIVSLGVLTIKPKKEGSKEKSSALLNFFVSLHNTFLVGLSLYMCLSLVYEAYVNKYNIWGNAYKKTEKQMAWVLYVFYVSKLYEFFDTFIMLLKGNIHQVSFLHVYHHGSISFIWWAIVYSAPGGDAYFSAALNSWVHVVMYCYYQLAVMIRSPEARKKWLWWGRYLTQMQMAQFVANMVQATYCLYVHSLYPRHLSTLLLYYMMTLLALFANFYLRKHVFGGAGKPGATGAAAKKSAKKSQ